MKKTKKGLLIILFLIPLIVLIFVVKYQFVGYNFENAVDCVNNAAHNENWDSSNVVYAYENNSYAMVMYNTASGEYFTGYCKKIKRGDKYLYKNVLLSNMMPPITHQTEWNKVCNSLYFIYVEYEDDIYNIDSCGYKPVGTKIQYKNAIDETKTCWIYVIDTSLDNNHQHFYNYKKRGIFGI